MNKNYLICVVLSIIFFVLGYNIGHYFGYEQRRHEDEAAWRVLRQQINDMSSEIENITLKIKENI